MRTLFAVLLGALLTAVAVAGAGVASAHATRIAADPAEGAKLEKSPPMVTATFNEALQEPFAAMTVVGPDGNLWSTGAPRVQAAVLGVELRPLGPAGTYTVNYRVTSADGHVVSGSWAFELTVAGTGTPGPPAAPPDTSTDDDMPVWPFVLGAALVVGVAAVWAIRRQQ